MSDESVSAECELEESPETVFQALTDPDIVEDWLEPPDGEVVERELIEAKPCSLVRYNWRSVVDERVVDSVVTFTLSETPDGGTRLQVVHNDFAVREIVAMRRAA